MHHFKSPGSNALVFEVSLDHADARHQLQRVVSLGRLCLSWHTSSGGFGSFTTPPVSVDALAAPLLDVTVITCPSEARVETSFQCVVQVVNRGDVVVDASVLFAPRHSKSISVRGLGVRDIGKLQPSAHTVCKVDICALAPGLQVIDGLTV